MSLTPTDIEIAVLTAQITVLRCRQRSIEGYTMNVDKCAEVRDIDRQIDGIQRYINGVRALRDDAQDKLRAIADGPHDDELCEKGADDPADESCAPCFAAHLLNRIHDEELNALAEFQKAFPGVIA